MERSAEAAQKISACGELRLLASLAGSELSLILGSLAFVNPGPEEMAGPWVDVDVERAILWLHPGAAAACSRLDADGFDLSRQAGMPGGALSAGGVASILAGSSRGAPNWIGRLAGLEVAEASACFDAGPAWLMVGDRVWPKIQHKTIKPSAGGGAVELDWPEQDRLAVVEVIGRVAIACCAAQGVNWRLSPCLAWAGEHWRSVAEAGMIAGAVAPMAAQKTRIPRI